MSSNTQGTIIAVLVVALIAALAAIAYLATSGNGDSGGGSALARATATSAAQPTSTSTLAPTSTPAPTATPVPPTAAPAPTQAPPPPPPTPVIRTCDQIRADPIYRSEEERQFFLQNCQATPRPAATQAPAVQQPPPAPGGAANTADEASYISRGTAAAGAYQARFVQYWGQPSLGARADLQELASVTLNFCNSLNAITPVPDRFRAAHNNLVSRCLAFYDTLRAFDLVTTQAAFVAWQARFDRTFDEFDAAFAEWLRVTGIQLPSLGGLR